MEHIPRQARLEPVPEGRAAKTLALRDDTQTPRVG
jgi:hypothetical protein